MSKNPFKNGILASAYIFLIVSVMNQAQRFAPKQDNFFMPVAFISLFTLSAAIMGYLFCLEPLQMFLEGQKKPAINLFLQTVMVFAIITVIVIFLAFTGLFPLR